MQTSGKCKKAPRPSPRTRTKSTATPYVHSRFHDNYYHHSPVPNILFQFIFIVVLALLPFTGRSSSMVRRGASATPYRCRGLKLYSLLSHVILTFCLVVSANAQLAPVAQGSSRLLLQGDGSTELVERFRLDLPAEVNPNDIEFVQKSSNGDTLEVNADRNIIPTRTGNGLNVTCTLDFDKLPGVTTYTLAAKRRGPNQPNLFETSITYSVVGMVLYKKNPDGTKTVVSGDSNPGYTIPFENAAQPLVQPDDRIYVFIQFPDGTTSENLPQSVQKIPFGNTLTPTVLSMNRQFNNDPENCNFDTIGTYSSTDGIILPPNCGFGFYRDAPGNLLFGFKWIPFRVGPAKLRFSWPGLTAVNTDLADETFESNFNAAVTGTPPIVVTKIDPSDSPFRTEGGQPVVVQFFNGNERPISDMRIQIEPGTFANLVPGSISPIQMPGRTQNATFVVQPGTGGPFDAKVQFRSPTTRGTPGTPTTPGTPGSERPWEDTVMEKEFKPAYDSKPLFIETITPSSGSPEGNAPVTLNGYFSNFDPTRDSVEFSGMKVPEKDIISSAPDKITFKSPPRSSLGSAPEYEVTVKVGDGVSNRVRYSYVVGTGELTFNISPTGTSRLGDDRYKVSACTPVQFTMTSTPATDQIKSIGWSLITEGDVNTDLFKTKDSLKSIDTSTGTIALTPDQIGAPGAYVLTVTITLDTGVAKKSIILVRDNAPAPGVSIPQVPKRTMSSPDAPVIINAVVTMPGACYSGDSSVRYQWEVFGKTYDFTPTEATGDGGPPKTVIRPGRLGRELIVPRDTLSTGTHKVDFRVWFGNATEPSANESTTFEVTPQRLIPVIRNAETIVETNWATDLQVFGTNSYDPDVLGPNKKGGITYKWSCSMAGTIDQGDKVACPDGLLPKDAITSPSFTIPKEEVRKLGKNINFIRYTLEVTKTPAPGTNATKDASTTLDVKIIQGGVRPILVDYSITLETVDQTQLDPSQVPTYETTILRLSGVPVGVKWSYELLEPKLEGFQFNGLLANSPSLYSPAEKLTGSRNPLGFSPNKLDSLTVYKVLIKFLQTGTNEESTVEYSFKTSETPRLGEIKPLPTGGDTNTVFTVDAGLTLGDDRFAFYFYITDSEGNEFCVGGCTGKHITYFRIPTPGTYTLSARLFDKRGFVELDKKVLSKPVVVKKSGNEVNTIRSLPTSFKTGDDAAWFHTANDISIVAADGTPSKTALEILFGRTYEDLSNSGIVRGNPSSPSAGGVSPEPSPEGEEGGETSSQRETYAQQRAKARRLIASGIRKIVCSSTPNSQSGRNAFLLVLRILRAPYISADTWYDLLFIAKCSAENARPHDAIAGEDLIPEILGLLYKHAESLDSAGLRRSRLRSGAGNVGSLAADAAVIVGSLMARAFGVGKLDGYKMTRQLGPNGKFGFVSMFVGSSADQMDTASVNGKPRQVLKGRTADELFYINSLRYDTVFPGGGAKRYIVLHTTPNFVVNSGLQDEPTGGSLGNSIYWPQVYGRTTSTNGIERLRPTSDAPAYCMRMPVEKKRDFFTKSMVRMPGMYTFRKPKPLGVEAGRKGEFFQYDRSGMKVIEFKVTPSSGWVEACHTAPKLFGATSITSGGDNAANSIGLQNSIISGDNGVLLPFIVGGGILVACVIIIIAWTVAFKAGMGSAGMGPYVERDATGRSADAPAPAAVAT